MAKIDSLSAEKQIIFNTIKAENHWQTKRGGGKDFMLSLEIDGSDLIVYPTNYKVFYKITKLAMKVQALELSSWAFVKETKKGNRVALRIY